MLRNTRFSSPKSGATFVVEPCDRRYSRSLSNGGGSPCPRSCWFWCCCWAAQRPTWPRGPDAYHVERSATVDAPAATVFAQIDDFSVWKEWSPWEKKDPGDEADVSTTPSGVGATYAWEGNKEVGKGKMTITDSRPGERVAEKLEFIEPFQSAVRRHVHARGREPDHHQGDVGDGRQAQLRQQGVLGRQADGRDDRQGLRGRPGEPQEGRGGEEAAARRRPRRRAEAAGDAAAAAAKAPRRAAPAAKAPAAAKGAGASKKK